MSFFDHIEMVPGDPILGLTEAYNADNRTQKVNLGVGIYYDEQGKIPVLQAVQAIEQQLLQQTRPRGYLPIDGLPAYNQATQHLVFGVDSPAIAEGRITTAQTVGGSGALKVGADLLKKLLPHATIAISRPSWENHRAIFSNAGFDVQEYTYFDSETHGVNFPALLADLNQLAPHTVVLLHACCHNPTGADLSNEEWKQLAELVIERQLVPFLDMAYQGFKHSTSEDAYAVRLFVEKGVPTFFVANSYSKSFSLYGERVGGFSAVMSSADVAKRMQSQIRRVIRANYSSPATHGPSLVAGILNSPELSQLWESELGAMRSRIHDLRTQLVKHLVEQGVPQYAFIQEQAGMFSYSGLTEPQVLQLRNEFGIYAVNTGRICVAGLNQDNLAYVANAVVQVSRN